MPRELFVTGRKTTKIRNAFASNMLTDIKLSKSQIAKIIQLGGSFGSWLANLGKKALINIVITLVRGNVPGLVSNLHSNTMNKFERKMGEKVAVRVGKRFTIFISNEDMNNIIEITKITNLWRY